MSEHRIESAVKVYLVFEDGRWRVDSLTMDGRALDGNDNPSCDFQPHSFADAGDKLGEVRAECERLRNEADRVSFPDGQELIVLMAEHLSLVNELQVVQALLEQICEMVATE